MEVAGLETPSVGAIVYLFHARVSGSLCLGLDLNTDVFVGTQLNESELKHAYQCSAY